MTPHLAVEVEDDDDAVGSPADDEDDEDAEQHSGGTQRLQPHLAQAQRIFLFVLKQVQVELGPGSNTKPPFKPIAIQL